jgi:hypothetical protein
MERARDKPQLVRVGSLIRFNKDGDIGIVTEVLSSVQEVQPLKVWWAGENARRNCGAMEHEFEPWEACETVLRY